MLEYELNGKIYTEQDLINAAGGKDKLSAYIKSKDFSYDTQSEKELKHLKETAEKEKYFESVKGQYDEMLKKLSPNKEKDLVMFKKEVNDILKSEILSRYYFAKGRVESMLKNDPDVNKAIEVLQDPARYKQLLTDVTDRSPLKDKVMDKKKKK